MNDSPKQPLRTRLAERVRDALRAEIQKGQWQKHLPSERYLSQEFQVGRPTLHEALCSLQREGLVEGRPKKPWLLISRSVPAPHRGKRWEGVVLLRNARAKPDLTSVLPLIDSVRHKLHHLGLDLVVVDAFTHGAKRLDKTLSEIDADYRPSFYFLLSVPADVHRWFQKHDLPTLILGCRTPDVRLPAIDSDPGPTVRHAMEYLFRRGHRRIALLLSVGGVGDTRITRNFEKCCRQHNVDGFHGTLRTIAAHPATVQSAVRKFFERTPFPTAIIANDLEVMVALYATLGELGLSIPRKVSVISTGYWPLLDYLSPMPTNYLVPWDRMATLAVRIVGNYQRLGVWPNKFYDLLPTLREGRSVARI